MSEHEAIAVTALPRAVRFSLLKTLYHCYKLRPTLRLTPEVHHDWSPFGLRKAAQQHLASDLGITPQHLSSLLTKKYYPSDELTEKAIELLSYFPDYRLFLGATQRISASGKVSVHLHFIPVHSNGEEGLLLIQPCLDWLPDPGEIFGLLEGLNEQQMREAIKRIFLTSESPGDVLDEFDSALTAEEEGDEEITLSREELEEEISVIRENIRILRGAKKDCNCEVSALPHYHVLINYDAESGDDYFEESDIKHHRFIEKLSRELSQLEEELKKRVES
jgi:transcriptional regulator with XRE-family HTH domain